MKEVVSNKIKTVDLSNVSEKKTYLVKDLGGNIGMIVYSSGIGYCVQHPRTRISRYGITLSEHIACLINDNYKVFEVEVEDF